MSARRLHLLALLLAPVLAAGGTVASCSSGPPKEPEPAWQNWAPSIDNEKILWEVTVLALEKLRYPLGTGLDPASMRAESGWDMHLQPFKGKGYRRQAVVQYVRDDEGRYVCQVRVRRQLNQSLINPLDPAYAEWEWTADDLDAAAVLLQHIRSRLPDSFEVTEPEPDPLEEWR